MRNSLPRLILLALVAASSSRAAEISGTVREVSGDTVTVTVQGDLVPAPGDKAEIFFKFAGGGDEIAVAIGSVTGEEAGTVKVKITQATGEVRKDHLARFTSSNPKPKTALLPSVPSTPSTPGTGATPPSPEAAPYLAEGLAKFDAKDFKGALAAFTKAIELDPTSAKAYGCRAATYASLKQTERALTDANEAIRLNPKYAAPFNTRGNCYVASRQFKRAIQEYDEAIRLDQTDPIVYYCRGTAYAMFGRNKNAIDDLTKAIELKPDYASAYYNRGQAYKASGKTQLAKQDLARVKELEAKKP